MNWAASKKWLQVRWPVDEAAALAVYLEASAPKAGNVTPTASFHDMDYTDFLVSGFALRQVFAESHALSIGQLILRAIDATQRRQPTNTNLGTVLLLAPLTKAILGLHASDGAPASSPAVAGARASSPAVIPVPQSQPSSDAHLQIQLQRLQAAIGAVLTALTPEDSRDIYAAIRLAKPGGLGRSAQHDVHDTAPADILPAMQSAASVDAVARQYVNRFADVCERMVVWLHRGLARGLTMQDLVAEIQLRWLAAEPDGLIVRKAGLEVAAEAQQLASWALDEWLETGSRSVRWQALDVFLRTDDHSRNPGTTADLIAAALFVLLTL